MDLSKVRMKNVDETNKVIEGSHYAGWVDIETNEPVKDIDVKSRYEERILKHTGVRLIGT